MNAEAQSAIYNLLNGNLTEAREIAKDIETSVLIDNAEQVGVSSRHSALMASYLKGLSDFFYYSRKIEEE
jgi:hypothetical protein